MASENALHFVDPNSAMIPAAELSAMSKTQLLQNVTVLHGGWTNAVKRLNDVVRNTEEMERKAVAQHAEWNAQLCEAERRAGEAEREVRQLKTRVLMLQEQNVEMRFAIRDSPDDPQIAELERELALSKGRVVELERLVRQREPLDVQFLRIRADEMEKQHERDKVRLQELTLQLARGEQLLLDARADADLERREHVANMVSSVGGGAAAGGDLAMETSMGMSGVFGTMSSFDRRRSLGAGSLPGRTVAVQTESHLIKTLDLLTQRTAELDTVRQQYAEAQVMVEGLTHTIDDLSDELERVRDSEQRKDAMLDDFSQQPALRRAKSFHNKGDVERVENDRVAKEEKLRKTEAAHKLAQEQLERSEDKRLTLEAELGKLSKSFTVVAEENVQLTYSLQALTGCSAKEVAVMMKAGENVQRLTAELSRARSELENAQSNAGKYDHTMRENGSLRARVEKYQTEVGGLAAENKHLRQELGATYERLEAQVEATLELKQIVPEQTAKTVAMLRAELMERSSDAQVSKLQLVEERLSNEYYQFLNIKHEALYNSAKRILTDVARQCRSAEQAARAVPAAPAAPAPVTAPAPAARGKSRSPKKPAGGGGSPEFGTTLSESQD